MEEETKHIISHEFGFSVNEGLIIDDKDNNSILEIVFDNNFLFDLTLNLKSKLQVDFSNKEGPDKYHQRFIETMEKEENGDYDYIYKNVACFLNNLSKGPIACGIGNEERTTFLKQMPVIEYFENPTSFKSHSLDDHKLIKIIRRTTGPVRVFKSRKN